MFVYTILRMQGVSNDLKQLLLPISLGGVIRPFSNNLKFIILQCERLFTSGKHPRQLPIFPGMGVPAPKTVNNLPRNGRSSNFTSKSYDAMLR